MKPFSEIQINKPFIALIAGGTSVLDITVQQWKLLKDNCFIITTNYGPVLFNDADLNVSTDLMVSNFFEKWMQKDPAGFLGKENFQQRICVREGRWSKKFAPYINYFYDPRAENLKTNYTILSILELLKKYHPEKTVLLFGVDGYHEAGKPDHYYDHFTDFRLNALKTMPGFKVSNLYKGFQLQLQKAIAGSWIDRLQIVNCNLKSKVIGFNNVNALYNDLTIFLQKLFKK